MSEKTCNYVDVNRKRCAGTLIFIESNLHGDNMIHVYECEICGTKRGVIEGAVSKMNQNLTA